MTKAVRKCGHVVKNLSKMKVVVGDILVVRWIWVSFFQGADRSEVLEEFQSHLVSLVRILGAECFC